MRRAGWNSTSCWSRFFRPSTNETGAAVAVEFRNRLVKLEQQVMSQYTSMAAYATIAKQDSESVKVEARADLDRSQATVIGLTEKFRNEINVRLDGLERRSAGGDLSADGVSRLTKVERDLAPALTAALQQCCRRTRNCAPRSPASSSSACRSRAGSSAAATPEALYLR